jgi:hypothetical protein
MEGKSLLIGFQDIAWWLPFLLYAETHYRFKYFFSLLRKREPEIIADAPQRLEPGQPLPLLILAKDANSFPCTLRQVTVVVRQQSTVLFEGELLSAPRHLDKPLWWEILQLDARGWSGWIELQVGLQVEYNEQVKTYYSDNHRTSTHKPLRIYVAPDPLPRFPDLVLGDAHTHSNYTDDQVEFGPPLRASRELCQAMGLSFFCATDHSYDLDDEVGTYLANDPDLPKWRALQAEIADANAETDAFAIVRGEEITCRNGRDRNVHFLLLGARKYMPGSGDGAERWLRTRSEHSIGEILASKEDDSIACAAHPRERVPFLQRLFLRRGNWSAQDLQSQGLRCIQFANGFLDEGFRTGKDSWVKLLLSGRHVYALGGNDAHGNFNRFRQVGIPFVKIKEMDHQLFGGMRTGVIVEGKVSEEAILSAMRNGRVIVSDGPVARMAVVDPERKETGMGGTARGKPQRLLVAARSTSEYGEMELIKVMIGEIGTEEERLAYKAEGKFGFDLAREITIEASKPSYVRAEVFTTRDALCDGQSHWCFTNPIWIDPGFP